MREIGGEIVYMRIENYYLLLCRNYLVLEPLMSAGGGRPQPGFAW